MGIADHAVCLVWRGKRHRQSSLKQADGAAQEYPAVTIAVTKKAWPKCGASWMLMIARMESLKGTVIPG